LELQQLDRVTLIDFGLCSRYIDDQGQHVPRKQTNIFKGNLVFGSKNAFKGQSLSRRDDLISLAYLLIYLVDGDLLFMQGEGSSEDEPDQATEFKNIGLKKVKMTPEELCITDESRKLLPFISEIYKLSYGEEPNYSKLNFILVKELMLMNMSPSKVYDWNENLFH
jgi:casein kinase 1